MCQFRNRRLGLRIWTSSFRLERSLRGEGIDTLRIELQLPGQSPPQIGGVHHAATRSGSVAAHKRRTEDIVEGSRCVPEVVVGVVGKADVNSVRKEAVAGRQTDHRKYAVMLCDSHDEP